MRAARGEHAQASKALLVRRLAATNHVAPKRLKQSKIRKPPAAEGEQEVYVKR